MKARAEQFSIISASNTIGADAKRWLKVLPLAAIVTGGLLIFMERLIHMTDMVVDETPSVLIKPIHWEEKPLETRRTEKPEKPEDPQPAPQIPETTDTINTQVAISIPRTAHTILPASNFGVGFDPNMPIAQFLVQPKYPSGALRRGTEGFVDVMFDVSKLGTTENIQVTRAQPQGVFENAAVNAVKKWKYQPKTINNEPVRYQGLTNRIRFEMQD